MNQKHKQLKRVEFDDQITEIDSYLSILNFLPFHDDTFTFEIQSIFQLER